MKPASRQDLPGALALIEEATHLLRTAEPAALCIYWAGTIPFYLAMLAIWAELARERPPAGAVAGMALVLVPLYGIMKAVHAEFCRRLMAQRHRDQAVSLHLADWWRLAIGQLRRQPWALVAFWAGALTVVAFPWALAYGQSSSVLGSVSAGNGEAAAQARLAPRQNAVAVVWFALVFLVVWINAYSLCLLGPWAADHLLGIESVFSRSGRSVINAVFLSASLVIAWVVFDPLLKAFYTLRVFYIRARHTGEDLRVDLKMTRAGRIAAWVALLTVGLAPAKAAMTSAAAETSIVEVTRLDRAVNRTLAGPEYSWSRPSPREDVALGPFARFGSDAFEKLESAVRSFGRTLERLWHWFYPPDPVNVVGGHQATSSWGAAIVIVPVVAVLGVLVFVILAIVQAQARRISTATALKAAPVGAPDLTADTVDASRLPVGGWLDLARESARRGEWRLALRATYLATLAELAAREFIRLARAKTNLDYERELRRRAAARLDVVDRFACRRRQFEAVWYGSASVGSVEVQSWIEEIAAGWPA